MHFFACFTSSWLTRDHTGTESYWGWRNSWHRKSNLSSHIFNGIFLIRNCCYYICMLCRASAAGFANWQLKFFKISFLIWNIVHFSLVRWMHCWWLKQSFCEKMTVANLPSFGVMKISLNFHRTDQQNLFFGFNPKSHSVFGFFTTDWAISVTHTMHQNRSWFSLLLKNATKLIPSSWSKTNLDKYNFIF